MNATPASVLGINPLPRPYGDMPWPVPLAARAERDVLAQARRHCPEWPDALPGFEYRVSALEVSFTPKGSGYELVRLSLHRETDEGQGASSSVVYAFHAPGDFRPLDGEGREIERLRLHAPIDFPPADDTAPARAAEYACLRLALEAPFLFRRFHAESAGTEYFFSPAAIVSSLENLPLDAGRLDAARRDLLMSVVRAPVVAVEAAPDTTSGDTRVYRVEASLCFADDGGVRVLRAGVTIDREGAMSVDPAQWTDAGVHAVAAEGDPTAAGMQPARTLQRISPIVGIDEWERIPLEGAESPEWVRRFLADYGLQPDTTVLRRARLPFYRTFGLVEVLERASPTSPYRRAYALVRFGGFEAGAQLDVRALNGQSYVIHGVSDEPDELVLDGETVEPYLRFFCWAVHGDRGPFLIPVAAREIPFTGRLRSDDARVLDGIDYRIRECGEGEQRFDHYAAENGFLALRRTVVAYGGAVFESWFAVQEDGTISMVEDTPLVADLPVEPERYGRGELFELRSWKRSSQRPAPRSSWQRGEASSNERPRRAVLGGDAMRGDAWRELLEHCEDGGKVVIADRDVTSPLVLAHGAGEQR